MCCSEWRRWTAARCPWRLSWLLQAGACRVSASTVGQHSREAGERAAAVRPATNPAAANAPRGSCACHEERCLQLWRRCCWVMHPARLQCPCFSAGQRAGQGGWGSAQLDSQTGAKLSQATVCRQAQEPSSPVQPRPQAWTLWCRCWLGGWVLALRPPAHRAAWSHQLGRQPASSTLQRPTPHASCTRLAERKAGGWGRAARTVTGAGAVLSAASCLVVLADASALVLALSADGAACVGTSSRMSWVFCPMTPAGVEVTVGTLGVPSGESTLATENPSCAWPSSTTAAPGPLSASLVSACASR